MRVGVSSRGNTWVSMGCLGWLIAAPFIAAALAVWLVIKLLAAIVMGIGWLIRRIHNAPAVPPRFMQPPRR
jgi:hypothetical protein